MGIPDFNDHPDIIRKDFPPSDCQSQLRYVALCDVLGFSALVKSYDTQTLAKKYDDMLREAMASCLMTKTYPSPKPWVAKRYRAGSAVFSRVYLCFISGHSRFNGSSPQRNTRQDHNQHNERGSFQQTSHDVPLLKHRMAVLRVFSRV